MQFRRTLHFAQGDGATRLAIYHRTANAEKRTTALLHVLSSVKSSAIENPGNGLSIS